MTYRSVQKHILALGALVLVSSPLYAATCFVKTAADGGVAGNSGADWANAKTLQAAIGDVNCDPIYVKGGLYKPTATTDRTINFAIRRPLKLYGGFAGTEATLADRVFDSAHVSILSGDIDNNDTNTDGNFINETWNDIQGNNSNNVVTIGGNSYTQGNGIYTRNNTVINGFHITGGSDAYVGGGLVCAGANTGNECSPTIQHVTLSGNSAEFGGGAFFSGSSSGASAPLLQNITVSGNQGTSNTPAVAPGAGLYFFVTGPAQMSHISVINNQAASWPSGGGIILQQTTQPILVSNSLFWGNSGTSASVQIQIGGTNGVSLTTTILEGGNSGCTGSACPTNALSGDPLLGVLQDNGGGMLTHMPALNGAAIDAGDAATCDALNPKVDQRGVSRPGGNLCDLGAVENYNLCLVASDGDATADGSTWATATTLQSALGNDTANLKLCHEVWVKQGTYLPTTTTDKDVSFKIIRDIKLYGGFVGTETALAQRSTDSRLTVLSGDIGTADVNTDNTKQVLYLDGAVTSGTTITAATIIDGFTIQNAYDGTGIYCLGNGAGNECSPTLRNLTLSNNKAPAIGIGGALYASAFANGKSSPSVTNVTFSDNQAFKGGAFALDTNGSGTSLPTFTNVTFANNIATDKGGALYVQGAIFAGSSNGKATLTHVTLTGNTAANGGAIGYTRVDSPASNRTATIEISNSVVWGNGAADDDFVNEGVFTGGGASTTLLRTVNEDTCGSGTTCTDTITTDPVLGTLQDNSGVNDTILPSATGSAVEAIAPGDCIVVTDQRGIQRPKGTNCDAGAVELEQPGQEIEISAPNTVKVGSTQNSSVATRTPNSGNTVTYSSSTPTQCSVDSSGAVTGIKAGINNCTIVAAIAAGGDYAQGSDDVTFSIAKADQAITNFVAATPTPVFKAGDTFGVNAQGGDSTQPVVFSIDPSTTSVCQATGAHGAVIKMLSSGDCIIKANQAADANYNGAVEVSLTVTIAKANQAGTVTISGIPKQGETLEASVSDDDGVPSTGVTYQWKDENDNLITTTKDVNTYTLTQNEVGKKIKVIAIYTDNNGTNEIVESALTSVVDNANDDASVVILGTPKQGEILRAKITDPDGVPTTGITYVWKADNVRIAGATSAAYTLTQDEVGKQITVTVSFTDDLNSDENPTSLPTAVVANDNDSASVTLTGMPKQGETLEANVSDDDGTPTSGITYQWKDENDNLITTTKDVNTYTLTQNEVGKKIKVIAIYTDNNGTNEIAESALTSVVDNANDDASVAILGTPKQGEILRAKITDPDGVPTTGITYEWKADNASIAGATSATYTLTQDEVGKQITVTVSFTDDLNGTENPTSEPTVVVVNDNDSASITISGIPKQGETLTANVSDDDGVPSTGVTYQWKDENDNLITTMKDVNTYTLTQNEVGKKIKVIAIYTDNKGTNEIVESNMVGPVMDINDNGSVVIEGVDRVNEVITAKVSDPEGVPDSNIRYIWLINGNEVSNQVDNNTFFVKEEYVWKSVSVIAIYKDAKGNDESVISQSLTIRDNSGTIFRDSFGD